MNLESKIFNGKGIYVFTDPAGANAVLAIIDKLLLNDKLNEKDFLVFTNHLGKFSKDYKHLVKKINLTEGKAVDIINKFNPDYIFSATSNNDFEHNWRIATKKTNVYSISFIDHWTNYFKRFTFNSKTVFSDEVWVIDSKAKSEAILDGIPKNIIRINSNPYYDKVKKYIPKISKDSFLSLNKINPKKIIILFISDEIRDIYDKDYNGNCILGFDEFTILKHILKQLNKIENIKNGIIKKYQLVIKIHPNSQINKFYNLVSKSKHKDLEVTVIKDCNPLDLLFYSNLNLGMFSNMVNESYLLSKEKTFRIQIGDKGIIDFFNTIRIIKNEKKLYNLLYSYLV